MKAMQNEHKADRGERAEKRNEFQMLYPDMFVASIVVYVYIDSICVEMGIEALCNEQS